MLTDAACRNAKACPRAAKLFDGGGLYLLVTPRGSKLWRLKYRYGGTEKLLALGQYPAVGLQRVRQRRDEARRLLAEGVDPGEARKADRRARAETFEAVAREWLAAHEGGWVAGYSETLRFRLTRYAFPHLGARPIAEIDAPALLAVARRLERGGKPETARRVLRVCGQVFRYAVATGRVGRDPTTDLRGALPPAKPKSFAALTEPRAIGALLRAIDGYAGQPTVCAALRLAPLVFVRPGELRRAEWAEIDLERAEWRIPGAKMKAGEPHIVPLARQAVAILEGLRPFTGRGRYVFPSLRSAERPMSENTVNAALRRLGYAGDEMTGHGFRAMASTVLNELGWPPDVIERQLAHAPRNKVRAAYNRAAYLVERRRMVQAWADHLDALRAGADVVPMIRPGAGVA